MKKEEKPTSGPAGIKFPIPDRPPQITYGEWSPTESLKWKIVPGTTPVLMQKMRRRIKRDWGHGCWSRSYEYEWFPVPEE